MLPCPSYHSIWSFTRWLMLIQAGPPVVEAATHRQVTKDELGGARIHTENGSIDNLATDEVDCFRQIRRFLSYLPSNVYSSPPCAVSSSNDPPTRRDEELLSVIPKRRQRPYDIRKLIHHIFDRDSFFEIGRNWGKSIGESTFTSDLSYMCIMSCWLCSDSNRSL